jgi:hypothetical protein
MPVDACGVVMMGVRAVMVGDRHDAGGARWLMESFAVTRNGWLELRRGSAGGRYRRVWFDGALGYVR